MAQSCGKCETTWAAAWNGHKECLEFCVAHGSTDRCPWDPDTTWIAAVNGQKECLEFIFENCEEHVTWETSQLELNMDEFTQDMRDYIGKRREEWIWMGSRGQNIKG